MYVCINSAESWQKTQEVHPIISVLWLYCFIRYRELDCAQAEGRSGVLNLEGLPLKSVRLTTLIILSLQEIQLDSKPVMCRKNLNIL